MIRKNILFFLIVLMFLSAGICWSVSDTTDQSVTLNVDEIAVVDVSGQPGAMYITAPTTGGQNPLSDLDQTTSLTYTSTVASGSTRTITFQMGSSDVVPAGTTLGLGLGAPQEGNQGTPGVQTSAIVITTSAQPVVTGIGSTATGTGTNKGCILGFTFFVNNVGNLVAGENKGITLTYTLTDDQ